MLKLNSEQMRILRGQDIAMIFQDPMTSLNPVLTVGQIVSEPLEIHHLATGKEKHERVAELFKLVGLLPDLMYRYPHEFSGGSANGLGWHGLWHSNLSSLSVMNRLPP